MTHYIKELISQGEHQRLDFKFAISDSRKIARTLVAFANTDGGTLLIGVKDNGRIAGVRSDEEYYMVEAAANLYCRPRIDFKVVKWKVEIRDVLEVKVLKTEEKSFHAEIVPNQWVAFVRVDDENIQASPVHLNVWNKKKQPTGAFIEYTETEQLLLKLLEAEPTITVSKFCRFALISKKDAEQILADMIRIGVVDVIYSDKHFRFRLRKEKTPEPSRLSGFI